jgi:hypothetical protein
LPKVGKVVPITLPVPLIQAELLDIIHNVELAVLFVPLSMLPDIAKSWQGCITLPLIQANFLISSIMLNWRCMCATINVARYCQKLTRLYPLPLI